jgi:hypothetical protein
MKKVFTNISQFEIDGIELWLKEQVADNYVDIIIEVLDD